MKDCILSLLLPVGASGQSLVAKSSGVYIAG